MYTHTAKEIISCVKLFNLNLEYPKNRRSTDVEIIVKIRNYNYLDIRHQNFYININFRSSE